MPCLARDFVGKLWETIPTFLKCMPYNFPSTKMLRQTMSIFAYQEHTQQLELCICKKYFTMSQRPVFSWNLSAQRPSVGLKAPLWQPTGQSPKNPYFFYGFPRVNYGLTGTGFWKPGFYSKFENTGLVRGKYGISTGKCWGPHVFTIPGA